MEEIISVTEPAAEVVASFTQEQIDFIMQLMQKIDIYADYLMGFVMFFVLVVVLVYCYKFFKMFF